MASKLYGVNATIIIFVFVLYCIFCWLLRMISTWMFCCSGDCRLPGWLDGVVIVGRLDDKLDGYQVVESHIHKVP